MKASEIPVGHLCYNKALKKYAIVCYPHDHAQKIGKVVVWLHNFCAAPVDVIDSYNNEDYDDLGPAPQFSITHKEVRKTEVKVEVILPE